MQMSGGSAANPKGSISITVGGEMHFAVHSIAFDCQGCNLTEDITGF